MAENSNEGKVDGDSPADPGASAGADSSKRGGLRRVASSAREGVSSKSRGPYKCKRCGQRHGEGAACGSATMVRSTGQGSASSEKRVELFNKENTARIVRMPFAVAAIRTTCADLALDDKQEAELATTGAVVLNEWVAVDPRYVALVLFAISISGVVFEKVLVYSMWLKLKELEIERLKLEAGRNRPAPKSADAVPASNATPTPGAFAAKEDPPPAVRTT